MNDFGGAVARDDARVSTKPQVNGAHWGHPRGGSSISHRFLPQFGCVFGRSSDGDVDVNGLVFFVGPDEDDALTVFECLRH